MLAQALCFDFWRAKTEKLNEIVVCYRLDYFQIKQSGKLGLHASNHILILSIFSKCTSKLLMFLQSAKQKSDKNIQLSKPKQVIS